MSAFFFDLCFMKRFGILVLVASALISCSESSNSIQMQNYGRAQGTTYSISYIVPEGVDFNKSIDSILLVIDKSMSTWDKGSIISRVNAGDSSVRLDAHFKAVFDRAWMISKESNGLFDCTVGPLVNAWGFGPEGKEELDSVEVNRLRRYVGFENVRRTKSSLVLPKGYFVDFNAIAQGYSVDVLADFLKSKGVQHFMVEVGGEVRCSGTNINEQVWRIGIDKPSEEIQEERFQTIVSLNNKSLATSGSYRKFYVDEVSGMKYSHTINPKTGWPVEDRLLSASIIANTAMDADAYATVCMVMGLEQAKQFIESKPDLEALFIYTDLRGEWQEWKSSGFEQMEQ